MARGDGEVNAETLEFWLERLPETLKGYKLKGIWNADETRLFWHALPNKLSSMSKDRCKGRKYAKQRVSIIPSMVWVRKNLPLLLEAA